MEVIIQSRQVTGLQAVPPVVSGVVALLAVAHFTQDPLSLVLLFSFTLSPQTVPFPVSLSVGARHCGNLRGQRDIVTKCSLHSVTKKVIFVFTNVEGIQTGLKGFNHFTREHTELNHLLSTIILLILRFHASCLLDTIFGLQCKP